MYIYYSFQKCVRTVLRIRSQFDSQERKGLAYYQNVSYPEFWYIMLYRIERFPLADYKWTKSDMMRMRRSKIGKDAL